jgi:Carboxypeptidase regulatory-like domain
VNLKKRHATGEYCSEAIRICTSWRAILILAALCLLIGDMPVLAGQSPDATPGAVAAGTPPSSDQLPHRISGRIVDQTGVAIVGARVRFTGEDPAQGQEALTGDDGQFVFANSAHGSFHLTVTAAGFAPQEFSGESVPTQDFTVPQMVLTVASVTTEVRVVPPSQVEIAREQIREEEKQRTLGIIPNFYVTYIPDAAPLAARQKFQLAWKSMVDPVTFGLTGVIAGLQQAQNDFSGYGQGAAGYARRYGAAYGDTVTGTLIGGAILPSLLKQDPRYFYKGTGSKRSRLLYAIATSVICKGDNGHWQANYSAIIGGLAAGGISNLYYPTKDREGAELTFENALIGIGANAAANVLQEFVIRKFTSNTPKNDPGSSSAKPSSPIARVLSTFVHEGD